MTAETGLMITEKYNILYALDLSVAYHRRLLVIMDQNIYTRRH